MLNQKSIKPISKSKKKPQTIASAIVPAASEQLSSSASERSLRLISVLAHRGRAMSLAELAVSLALPKTTAHRLCQQLLLNGFIARDLNENFFTTGPALRSLAIATLTHDTVRGLRHEVLSSLVAQINETCNLTTLDGARVVYLDRVEAHWPLRLTLEIGSHVPLHCTASGKLLLAMLPEQSRETVLDHLELTALTANTIVSRKALRAECHQIVKRGYATDNEEFMAGLIAVAVPLVGADGQARATIAVHAPVARLSLKAAISKLSLLQAAAKKMSALL